MLRLLRHPVSANRVSLRFNVQSSRPRSSHPKGGYLISSLLRSCHTRTSHLRSNHMINNHSAVLKESKYVEKIPFLRYKNAKSLTKRIRANIKAKNRGTKGYKSMSIDKLLSMLDKSEPVKKLKLCKI